MTIVVSALARDQEGLYRFQGKATLGEGAKVVLGIHADEAEARKIALTNAQRAERYLAAVEVHDPEEAQAPATGVQTLRAPDGTIVEATAVTVPALLAAGYAEADATPQRTDEAPPVPRRPGRPRRADAPDDDDMA